MGKQAQDADEKQDLRKLAADANRIPDIIRIGAAILVTILLLATLFHMVTDPSSPRQSGSDGDVIFLPVIGLMMVALLLFPLLSKPRPARTKLDLANTERADRGVLWMMPAQALLGLGVAFYFIKYPHFSLTIFLAPVMILALLLPRFHRGPEDFIRAAAANAMAAGFIAAVFGMCGLMLAAWAFPEWLVRALPLGLAVPLAVAAGAYCLQARQAEL
ncbi:MAG: hypothetical protein JWM33_3604 [Caulobacteraceae bacterium]|nr:hypothetical protein [Caulobacteraceae bacterium]